MLFLACNIPTFHAATNTILLVNCYGKQTEILTAHQKVVKLCTMMADDEWTWIPINLSLWFSENITKLLKKRWVSITFSCGPLINNWNPLWNTFLNSIVIKFSILFWGAAVCMPIVWSIWIWITIRHS